MYKVSDELTQAADSCKKDEGLNAVFTRSVIQADVILGRSS